jgi:2-methylcitrate dehydratase PrpD
VCAIPRPTTGLEVKFSLAATTALALLGADTTDVATFSDRTATDPAVIQLVERVTVETDPAVRSTASRVEVHAASGVLERAYDTGVPATDLAAQSAKLHAKFLALATPVVGAASAARLADDVAGLAELDDVRRLVPLTAAV